MSERIFLDDWKPHLWKEVEYLRGEAAKRFVSYAQNLEVPYFEFDDKKPYRRLLFHFSPKSRVAERGDSPLLPMSPLIAEDFIPKVSGDYDWEKIPEWVNQLPKQARQQQIFFFLDEPFPQSWNTYPWYFEFCLAYARKGSKEPLDVFALETVAEDEAYAVDREPMAIYQFYHKALIWEGVSAYGESLVPLEDYKGGYVLPEVIIPYPIASRRLIHIGQVDIPDVPVEFRLKPKPLIFTVTGELSDE